MTGALGRSGRPRAAFFGTPEAAVPSLNALAQIADVILVVTRPNKPRGRSGTAQPSAIKQRAIALGLPLVQPSSASEIAPSLVEAGPLDVALVTAFGMLIGPDALGLSRRGFLNVHFSLLPRWRGASPVSAAIAAGDEETGVSIMMLDAGLDTGPVLAARTQTIGRDEDAGSLTARLAELGASLMTDTLGPYLGGKIDPVPQGPGAILAPRISKAQTFVDLHDRAEVCARRVRALSPRPGANLFLEGRRVRLAAARAIDRPAQVGSIKVEEGRLFVGAGGTTLEVLRLQPAGKGEMSSSDWLRGLRSYPTTAS